MRGGGGVVSPEHRVSAQKMVEALLFIATHKVEENGFPKVEKWRLLLSSEWEPTFPRPFNADMDAVELDVVHGCIDLAPLRDASEISGAVMRFWKKMRPGGDKVALDVNALAAKLLANQTDKTIADSTIGQLSCFIGARVDTLIMVANIGKGWTHDPEPFQKWLGCSRYVKYKDLAEGYQMEHMMLKYMLGCREAIKHKSHIVMSSDAHDGCGRKFFNSVIGWGVQPAGSVSTTGGIYIYIYIYIYVFHYCCYYY